MLVLYTAGALAVIGMAGLAFDMGLVYLTKTRLQNALDAAALDGARTLDLTENVTAAAADALATLELNLDIPDALTPTVETSATQSPFVAGSTPAEFVRVTVTDYPVSAFLTKVLGFETFALTGSALAGPLPLGGTLCGALPVTLCGTDGTTDETCWDDGDCFGLTSDATGEIEIKTSASIGPGNYGLLELSCGSGANCVKKGMAGGEETCFDETGSVETEPGVASGPVSQGLNTRFNVYAGGTSASEYPGDVVTTGGNLVYPVPTVMYDPGYLTLLRNEATWNNPGGVPKRRTALIPIVDCSGGVTGKTTVPVIGSTCLFLTRQSPSGGPTGGNIYAQFIKECGVEGGAPTLGGSGHAIVLYQTSPEA